MFLLLKPASANSQVTLVTCSGAFINTRFRKVWFYRVKHLLLLANVSKTPPPQPPALAAGCHPAGTLGGAFWAVLSTFGSPGAFFCPICASPRAFFVVFLPDVDFTSFFFEFGRSGGPSGHQKTTKITVLSSIFKGSPNPRKCPSETTLGSHWDHFWHHFGRRWAPWGALGSPFEVPRLPKSPKKW